MNEPDGLDRLLDAAREAAGAAAAVALAWRDRADELAVEEKAAPDDLVSQADREAERAARAVLANLRPDDAVLGEEEGTRNGGGAWHPGVPTSGEVPGTAGPTSGEVPGTAGPTSGEVPGTSGAGVRWAIDPIDGTTNYLYGRPDWAVSVAAIAVADGRILAGVVAEPALGTTTEARAGGGAWSAGRRLGRAPSDDLARALVEVNLGVPEQRPLSGRLMDALVGRVRDVRRGGSAAAALAQVASGRADAYWGPGLQAWDGAAGLLLVAEAGGTVGDLTGPTEATWPESGDVLAAPDGLWEPLRELLAGVYVPAPR